MNRFTIYLLALGVFLTATSEMIVSGILPVIANDLGSSVALAGQLITVYSLAFAVGTPLLVSLTARMDRRMVLVASMAVFIAGCFVSVFSSNMLMMMVSRVILGVSAGVYLVVAFGAAARIVPAERLGSAIGTIVFGFSSAMILGVPLGIAVTHWFPWQAIFIILGALSLPVTFVILRLLPKIEGDAPVPFIQQFKVLGSMIVVSGLLLTFLRESGNSILFTYVSPYMIEMLQVNASQISIIMLAFGLFGAVGSRLGGYGVDRWGAARVITISSLLHIAALSLLPLLAGSTGIGLLLIALSLSSMFLTGPAIQTYFIQQAPGSANLIMSLNTSVIHLGLAAGAGTGGAIMNDVSSTMYHPWASSIVVTLGLAAALVSFRLGKRRSMQAEKIFPV